MQVFNKFCSRVCAVSVAALVVGFSHAASADTSVGADLDVATVPFDDSAIGTGVAFRLGSRMPLPVLVFTPELALRADFFGPRPDVYRGLLGLRLGLGEVLRPGVMAHLGVGHVSDSTPKYSAFSYDAGGFLDLTLLPVIDVGVHATYNSLGPGDGVAARDWAAFGLHADLIF